MIEAIDAGNSDTKFYDGVQLRKFPSDIGFDYRERNLKQTHGEYDFEWEYKGQRGFAGTLAQFESYGAESQKGDTKAHFDAQLRILLALHQFSHDMDHYIVVGQPINTHTQAEKQAIKEMLCGRHDLTVNGVRRTLVIRRCEVAAEGVTAGILLPAKGIVRVIDIGSGTVNFGSLRDGRYIDRDSFSVKLGMNTNGNMQEAAFARVISLKTSGKWNKEDQVWVCGGGAPTLLPHLREYFPSAEMMQDPVFANVKAFYAIARKIYG